MKSRISWSVQSRVLVIGAGIGLVCLGLVLGKWWEGSGAQLRFLSGCKEGLLDPAACSGDASNQLSFEAFRKDLEDHLESARVNGAISSASIFFRDLHNGPQLTINTGEGYAPMSLMKMPLMVAILKYAETHPGTLQEKLHSPSSFATNVQVMDPDETILPDHDYTIEELLGFMIAYSDNRALSLLGPWFDQKAGRGAIVDTLVDLGLMRRQDALPDAEVTARTYGSILRILYSASYLNIDFSQKALELLTHTKFKDGLAHDIGSDVRIAHKFGVLDDGSGVVQLHDCGIVYHPAGPYILCVMTKGTNYERQARYIQDVAARVYERVQQGADR